MKNKEIIACICEGGTESVILNKLLDAGKLIFTRDDLLDNRVLRSRTAKDFEDKYLGKSFNNKITVYRNLIREEKILNFEKFINQK